MCFLAGSFLLGVTEGGKRELDWGNLAKADHEDYMAGTGLMETCVDTYDTATGLGAEIVMFRRRDDPLADEEDWYIKTGENLIDSRNILRPETVESLFLAYRLTGDERYREYGWKIFKAFERHCKVDTGGYAVIKDVRVVPAEKEDRMETFWLSETLSELGWAGRSSRVSADVVPEYLYLLFDDSDHIPLDKHVFNTEAHILPVFNPKHLLTPFATS